MPQDLVNDGSRCPACGADQPIREEAVTVDVEFQGHPTQRSSSTRCVR